MNLDRIWTLQLKKKDGNAFWFFLLIIEWLKYFKFSFSLKVLNNNDFSLIYNKILTSQEDYRYFHFAEEKKFTLLKYPTSKIFQYFI